MKQMGLKNLAQIGSDDCEESQQIAQQPEHNDDCGQIEAQDFVLQRVIVAIQKG